MNLGPVVCLVCECVMNHIDPGPARSPCRVRCSRCGRTAAGDPKDMALLADYPEENPLAKSWIPEPGDLVVVAAGTHARHYEHGNGTTIRPLRKPHLVTVRWVTRLRLGWKEACDDRAWTAQIWETLPGPTPMEQLAQIHAEGAAG
jgi:hypothetical protein